MGSAQRTFLQGLSEIERDALLFHVEGSTGGQTDGGGSNRGSRADLEHARNVITRERERRKQLEAQVTSLQAKVKEQSTQLDALRNERDALRHHAMRNDDRGVRLASQLASLEQENASLSAKLLAANNDRAQLQSKIDTMQIRIAELQQAYVTMATSDDGVERRDLIRRSKIGGLMADMAATGVLDADLQHMGTFLQQRQTQRMAFSTIAALTRERDTLQQRLTELSDRLSESVSREAATRGTHALRSASWKRSAVQAEARLTTTLKRVRELSDELRKRDSTARQRERYLAQLERTVMAQHKSLQQLRRLLENGVVGGGGAPPHPRGSRDVPSPPNSSDSVRPTGHGATPPSPSGRGAGGRKPARQEQPGACMVRFHEGRGSDLEAAPGSPSRSQRLLEPRNPHQHPYSYVHTHFVMREQQGPRDSSGAGGHAGSLQHAEGMKHHGGVASAAAGRHSAGGGDPWTGRPLSPSRLGRGQPRAQSADAAASRIGGRVARADRDAQFEAPRSPSDASVGEVRSTENIDCYSIAPREIWQWRNYASVSPGRDVVCKG
ncbi:hypothetical protein Vretimale_7842 [Volvox reticuliferus]|uniref:Uncharacterized protein n=1 Tax=Volvox reticuliferus TaxID=1737510 RepID=A0A8J4FHE5_9CHLO|nr:hypothetical protein Vretifemale_4991 [Volvox reticuliferus]GIM03031.1 hypothetical protein Vretimale_7842 [Volvox reticuliferus]